MLAPVGDVYQAGTLSGNPLAVAAGLATLALLDEPAYARLDALTDELAAGLREAAAGHPVQVVERARAADGVLQRAPGRATSRTRRRCDLAAHAAWCRALLARGVYPPPSQFEAWFPSLWRTPRAQIERHGGGGRARLRQGGRRSVAVSGGRARAPAPRCCATRAGCSRRSSTATAVAGAAPSGAIARLRSPPPARAPRAAREEYELLVEAIYEGYLLHYGAPRVVRSARGRPAGCSPATASTRSGWRGWSRWATRARSPSWPTRSRCRALAAERGRAGAGRGGVGGRRARRRVGPDATRTARPRSWSSRAAPGARRGDAHKRSPSACGVALKRRLDIVRRSVS